MKWIRLHVYPSLLPGRTLFLGTVSTSGKDGLGSLWDLICVTYFRLTLSGHLPIEFLGKEGRTRGPFKKSRNWVKVTVGEHFQRDHQKDVKLS